MLTNQKLSEVMTSAAEKIAEHGLAKHVLIKHYGPTTGAMCVRGAVMSALGLPVSNASFYDAELTATEEAVWPLLAAELPDGFHYVWKPSDDSFAERFGSLFWEREPETRRVTCRDSLAWWNNSANRTQDEVVSFLRRCAEVFAARHAEGEIEARVPVQAERTTRSIHNSAWGRAATYATSTSASGTWTTSGPLTFSSSTTYGYPTIRAFA